MKHIFPLLLLTLVFIAPITVYAQKTAVPVFVAEVESKLFVDEIESLGTLQASENVELTSTVTELITKVNFKDGQRVVKGTVLVEMDAAEEYALRAEEQSRLNEAARQVKRQEPLVASGAASKSTLDEHRLELQTAQARMRAVESRIRHRKIIAPFDGVLGQRNVSVGSLSQPGTVITTIDDDSMMKLDFSVPEIFISVLKKGVKIEATTRAWPDGVFTGTIASINSRVDPITRAVAVRALLENPDYKLRPGLLMRVRLQKNPRQALVIPEEALLTKGEKNSVMGIVREGDKTTVKKIVVELGARRKGEIEILNGLKEGMQIVTHGNLRIRSGSFVEIKAVETGDQSVQEMLGTKPELEGKS